MDNTEYYGYYGIRYSGILQNITGPLYLARPVWTTTYHLDISKGQVIYSCIWSTKKLGDEYSQENLGEEVSLCPYCNIRGGGCFKKK